MRALIFILLSFPLFSFAVVDYSCKPYEEVLENQFQETNELVKTALAHSQNTQDEEISKYILKKIATYKTNPNLRIICSPRILGRHGIARRYENGYETITFYPINGPWPRLAIDDQKNFVTKMRATILVGIIIHEMIHLHDFSRPDRIRGSATLPEECYTEQRTVRQVALALKNPDFLNAWVEGDYLIRIDSDYISNPSCPELQRDWHQIYSNSYYKKSFFAN